jgi:hypothetical protein
MRDIYSGVPYNRSQRECYVDDVHSFFIHCHHISDWIVTLNKLEITSKNVDQFIRQHRELQICADLCNGTKHCRLSRQTWTRVQPHLVSTSFESDGVNGVFHTMRGKFEIMIAGEFRDALVLAEECMSLWDGFLATMRRSAKNKRS